jgi:hypothetical protein
VPRVIVTGRMTIVPPAKRKAALALYRERNRRQWILPRIHDDAIIFRIEVEHCSLIRGFARASQVSPSRTSLAGLGSSLYCMKCRTSYRHLVPFCTPWAAAYHPLTLRTCGHCGVSIFVTSSRLRSSRPTVSGGPNIF